MYAKHASLLSDSNTHTLTHCGRVTHYGDGSMLCKNPMFFIMKEFPQI